MMQSLLITTTFILRQRQSVRQSIKYPPDSSDRSRNSSAISQITAAVVRHQLRAIQLH